jgi:hypothetical protein
MKLLSRRVGLSLAVVVCAVVVPTIAYYPTGWSYSRQIAKAAAAKWGNKAYFLAVAAEDLRSDIFSIISACTTANGQTVTAYACADAVSSAAMAFGLSVVRFSPSNLSKNKNLMECRSSLIVPLAHGRSDQRIWQINSSRRFLITSRSQTSRFWEHHWLATRPASVSIVAMTTLLQSLWITLEDSP